MASARNSAFELARILCMLAIVFGHFVGQSHITLRAQTDIRFVTILLGSGTRIAVNVFIMISAWFMVRRPFRSDGFLKIYGQLWFYSVVTSYLCHIFFGTCNSIASIVRPLFPVSTLALWYISAHLSLMLLSPFLNKVFLLPKKQLQRLLAALFILLSGMTTFFSICSSVAVDLTWGEWVAWFSFVYLVIGYIKLHVDLKKLRTVLFLVLGLGIWLSLATIRAAAKVGYLDSHIFEALAKRTTIWLYNASTLPCFLSSLLIFIFVATRKTFSSRVINNLSASTLGVYIIHQVPVFYPYLWTMVFPTTKYYHSPYLPLYIIFVVVTTFLGASLIDNVRKMLLEPLWVKSRLFRQVQSLLDKFYACM